MYLEQIAWFIFFGANTVAWFCAVAALAMKLVDYATGVFLVHTFLGRRFWQYMCVREDFERYLAQQEIARNAFPKDSW